MQAEPSAASRGRPSERAITRTLAGPLRGFLRTESGGAAVLLAATVAALVWANAAPPHSYESIWTTRFSIRLGDAGISQDLRNWINDGLMSLFFLVVGLEARRELETGQLRERWTVAVPTLAALGGMAAPVAIYLAFNAGTAGAHGWGAAMSTDTAFLLGVLALVAPGGTRLRVRLLTLALVDDLVALVVIATAYTRVESLAPLLVAIALLVALAALRFLPRGWRTQIAAVLAVAIWIALYESGVDPMISGLAVGLITSAQLPHRARLGQAVRLMRSFREQPTPQLARNARRGVALAISPNERLQHVLHPWTSFVIVPLFALANAGIRLDGNLLARAFSSPVTLGILVGYVVGKPLGITTAASLALRLGVGRRALSPPVIVGGGVVAGIGFTVSLLIASIAFHGADLEDAKVGILATPILAAAGGWATFRLIAVMPRSIRERQIAATVQDLVDLSQDIDPARDHIRGAQDAPVTLLEYGDYECPYCGRAEAVVRELFSSFGDDLRYVWRHLPLTDVHPHADIGAEAAEAAGAQGAFWGMHEKLLAHQDALTPRELSRYARELGLDIDRFWDDLRQRRHADRVAEDVSSADASGVAGTPSFFVNGRRHQGAYDVASLTAAVRAARARASADHHLLHDAR